MVSKEKRTGSHVAHRSSDVIVTCSLHRVHAVHSVHLSSAQLRRCTRRIQASDTLTYAALHRLLLICPGRLRLATNGTRQASTWTPCTRPNGRHHCWSTARRVRVAD